MKRFPQETKQKFCLHVHKHVASNTHVHAHTCLGFTAAFLTPDTRRLSGSLVHVFVA